MRKLYALMAAIVLTSCFAHTTAFGQTKGAIVINEVLPSNKQTVKDAYDQFDDWIELYNTTDAAVKMSGYYLTDDLTKAKKWKFPNVTIPAHGYLIVWADKDDNQTQGLHCNFKLAAEGELVALTNKDGAILDKITFVAQKPDISVARVPNGSGAFKNTKPTFNAPNQ